MNQFPDALPPDSRRLLEIAYQAEEGSSERLAPSREVLGSGENPTAAAFQLGRGCSSTPSLRLAIVAVSLGISAIYFEKPSTNASSCKISSRVSGSKRPAGMGEAGDRVCEAISAFFTFTSSPG